VATETSDVLKGIELEDDEYTVKQALFRNKYRAYDASGDLVLQSKQKLFQLKEEFPFLDSDENPAFSVKAGGVLDIAGNYALIDAVTDEPVVILDKNWTLLIDRWKIRDPETESLVAEITSKSKAMEMLRLLALIPYIGIIFLLVPHSYEITDADGDHVGSIEGQFSLKDEYEVSIDDASDVPKEAIVAAAMVIDAIEGN
jgi:uncharacterized protein YxjI